MHLRWGHWRRPGRIVTGLASAVLVSFCLTPAGPATVIGAGRLLAAPGCGNPQWLVQVPQSTVVARSGGSAEWKFPRDYDLRLVCLAGNGTGGTPPSARQAGQATLSTRSGQCPSRTATFRDDLGGHASPWRGTGFVCITDNVVLRTGTAAGIRPRVRFYYCPDTICLRTMTRSLRPG